MASLGYDVLAMGSAESKKIYRFGAFEADGGSGELRKSGVRLRLQEQPFQVLLVLLERPGELVTRDELRRKLWPADTFVDFDHGLNTIMNKLREVLGDSAANPRFIETLAKRGYRFLPPVVAIDPQVNDLPAKTSQTDVIAPNIPQPMPPPPSLHEPNASASVLTRVEDLPTVPHSNVRVLLALIQVMYLSFYIVTLARIAVVEDLLQQTFRWEAIATAVVVVSALIGIPLRLYLLSAVSFDVKGLEQKFRRLFPLTLIIDELWALSPFLLAPQIGIGLALGITAALIYLPFAQRTLILMRERSRTALV
jgi:DNA-binding winged helix-turn-helix (wHTH) protein